MNVKREEECYDASTDDEGGEQMMLKPVVVKKEEDVDTDDEMLGIEAQSRPLLTILLASTMGPIARVSGGG